MDNTNVHAISLWVNIAAPEIGNYKDARDAGHVIDATCGHKTRAVLVTDSEHVILSPLMPETIAARIEGKTEEKES